LHYLAAAGFPEHHSTRASRAVRDSGGDPIAIGDQLKLLIIVCSLDVCSNAPLSLFHNCKLPDAPPVAWGRPSGDHLIALAPV